MEDLQDKLDSGNEDNQKQVSDLKLRITELEAANENLGSQVKVEPDKESKNEQTEMLISHIEKLESTLAKTKERLKESEEKLSQSRMQQPSQSSSKKVGGGGTVAGKPPR